jgi:hypothetical protein
VFSLLPPSKSLRNHFAWRISIVGASLFTTYTEQVVHFYRQYRQEISDLFSETCRNVVDRRLSGVNNWLREPLARAERSDSCRRPRSPIDYGPERKRPWHRTKHRVAALAHETQCLLARTMDSRRSMPNISLRHCPFGKILRGRFQVMLSKGRPAE